jgi:hypothetical protein
MHLYIVVQVKIIQKECEKQMNAFTALKALKALWALYDFYYAASAITAVFIEALVSRKIMTDILHPGDNFL